MLDGKKVAVVMPAYNAAATLERTLREVDRTVVDEVILVDDASHDDTVETARRLGLRPIVHDRNLGYGGNQKTCYTEALRLGADVVVMLHPDYQYAPQLLSAMASLVTKDQFDVVLGSRMLSGGAVQGGMPVYKYIANRALTFVQNVVASASLSEYHTGYRVFSREVLETLPLKENSDDFVFDAQILAQCFYFGFRIGELSCPTRYEAESSSINFYRSAIYGVGVLEVSARLLAERTGLMSSRLFASDGRRLSV